MVCEWLCPNCDRKFYSSNDSRDEAFVECANCGEEVENFYFRGKRRERDQRAYKQLDLWTIVTINIHSFKC